MLRIFFVLFDERDEKHNKVLLYVLTVSTSPKAHIQPWVSARHRQSHIYGVNIRSRWGATELWSAPEAYNNTDPHSCTTPAVEALRMTYEETEEG